MAAGVTVLDESVEAGVGPDGVFCSRHIIRNCSWDDDLKRLGIDEPHAVRSTVLTIGILNDL